ncbi:bifunctional 2-polyprenyl-6-hydroxyphenol methylase/3-demethylubiquinol 3-O-methyltransferase UbiG [Thermococcus sp.]|uniref:class I SAM-dependent methyltransferase n=1 Tax=Thermococcus sp. TaxID=35749 RepID=UPI0025DD9078|nr:class I SAM-dependent methyltransferase [Thermococcus sp.]
MNDEWYERRKRKLREMYWGKEKNPFLPSGFREYPQEIYDFFLSFIDHPGKVIDLGCGNGLLLRHLVENSRYELIPYGVDFIEESIEQAKREILPEFATNFTVANVRDYVKMMPDEYFDFIFFDPYHLHPNDLQEAVEHVIRACKPGGKVIFYTYRDVLRVLRVLNLFKLRWIGWVGDLLPDNIRKNLRRFDHSEVSVGVFEKEKGKSNNNLEF